MALPSRKPRAERVTQEARRAASDRRLIAAGIRLVAAQGIGGTSLAQIGEEAGYSRGLTAERFGSKLRFLEALTDHMEEWFRRHLAGRLEGRSGLAEVTARIAQHLDGAVEATEATRALYHLYADAVGVAPGLRPRMLALSDVFIDGFADAIRDGQRTREIDPGIDAERCAALIVGAVRGAAMQFLLDGDEDRLRSAGIDLIALFERELRRKAPAKAAQRATPAPKGDIREKKE